MEALENSVDPEMDRIIANEPKDGIPGWGMDADPENDPTYPMKHWNGADHERIHYEKAPQQPRNIEVLQSIERPSITRVFGTSTPPSGLSGAIRRAAFKYSEGKGQHWMGLVLADKVNVVEGVIEDLKNGHMPNFVAELGWPAEWKYNRKKFVTRIAVKALAVALVVTLLKGKSKKD
jgi:hypothetical protein